MRKSLASLLVIMLLTIVAFCVLDRTYRRVGKRVQMHRKPEGASGRAEGASRNVSTSPPATTPAPANASGLSTNVPASTNTPPPRVTSGAGADRSVPAATTPGARTVGALADPAYRAQAVARLANRQRLEQEQAQARAQREGWDAATPPGVDASAVRAIRGGRVVVYHTENANAAISTAASQVRSMPPYDVDGTGLTIGLWDQGAPLANHQEYNGRIRIRDGAAADGHASHVAGTMIGSGVQPAARGMAPAASIDAYEWNSDLAEMTARAQAAPGEAGKLRVSNHSYGPISGWYINEIGRYYWYGTWGNAESEAFGQYTAEAALWDQICYNAPYYLPFKSAGNDRSDRPPSSGVSFFYYDGTNWVSKSYNAATDPPADYWDQGGFDTMPDFATAKNIMTVGAVNDAVIAGTRALAAATMAAFSSWGPTDDGRVKPDIVANGTSLYSAYSSGTSSYNTLSGTSMSSPNAAGSAALLIAYRERLLPGDPMTAAMLKGLILHTADDLGRPGPDYAFGWGLMNTRAAADHLRLAHEYPSVPFMRTGCVTTAAPTQTVAGYWDGASALRVTLVWTDPPAGGTEALDDPTPRLVNDLDLRVIGPGGETNFPYVLDASHPTNNATFGDNSLDNVEQVYVSSPGATGLYTVVVTADGAPTYGTQDYALLIGGMTGAPEIEHVPLVNQPGGDAAYNVEAVVRAVTGVDTGSISVLWNTVGATGGFSTTPMTLVSGQVYRATLPAQPVGTTVYYALSAREAGGLAATLPAEAPQALFSFEVRSAVTLAVFGSPRAIGVAEPTYGLHGIASGNRVEAHVDAVAEELAGHRQAVVGWRGSGDAPAIGSTNNTTFTISQISAIMWLWESQYRLVQESSPTGLVSGVSWWHEGTATETETAPDPATVGTVQYRFAEWRIDGIRFPDDHAVAPLKVTGIGMTDQHAATAIYLEASVDADADGLSDWWERRYFGSLDAVWGSDDDGDGYLNLEEFQDGTDPRDPASIPTGPTILHTALADPQTAPAPWLVTARVEDAGGVGTAVLRWRRNELSWRQKAMTFTGTATVYAAEIPAPGILGDTYEYQIEAADESGYRTTTPTYSFRVAYPQLGLTPTNFVVNLLVGETTNLVVSLSNDGNADLVWTADVAGVAQSDDVESGTNGWTHSGTNDLWHITQHRAFSGSYAWYCGHEATWQYDSSMDARLVSPAYRVAEGARLSFNHWMRSELQDAQALFTWDAGTVEISTDDGASFTLIEPIGGYPSHIVNNPASPFEFDTPCFGGSGAWRHDEFALDAYAGQSVRFRFRFGSDAYVVDEGWYVDDITVGPLAVTNDWVTPVPTEGLLAAGAATNLTVRVDATTIPTGTDDSLLVRLNANDPTRPTSFVQLALHIRSRPEVVPLFAAQTSRHGEGLVTITNAVSDADGEPCALELVYSVDGGMTWLPAPLSGVSASSGSPAATGVAPLAVSGVVTRTGFMPVTNLVTTTWSTRATPAIAGLAHDVRVSCRAWDGAYWSAPAVTTPFMVDNEAPIQPAVAFVTSHTSGVWSAVAGLTAVWSASSDGAGVGLGPYQVFAGDAGVFGATPVAEVVGTNTAYTVPREGSNWVIGIRGADFYGNTSAVTRVAGGFAIDLLPPTAAGASVVVTTSPYGPYIIGDDMAGSWSGFADSGSGIGGYYVSNADHGGTTQGVWTTGTAYTLPGVRDTTNTFGVWAADRVGHIGPAAVAVVVLLSAGGDFDGDRYANGIEARIGTDATDPLSVLALTGSKAGDTPNTLVVQWPSVTGLLYSVYGRSTLTNGTVEEWLPVPGGTNLPGTGSMLSHTGTVTIGGVRYYRLGAQF